MSLFGSPYIVREAGFSLTCSHFPLWQKPQGKFSLGNELCCLGIGELQVKWNCPSYPLQYSDMFATTVWWHFLARLLDLQKSTLIPECHFVDVTQRPENIKLSLANGASWVAKIFSKVVYDSLGQDVTLLADIRIKTRSAFVQGSMDLTDSHICHQFGDIQKLFYFMYFLCLSVFLSLRS